MKIIPSMHIKSPEAIIADEGEWPFRAQRAEPPRGARSAVACRAL